MKTPAQILNEHTPLGKGYHSSWIIPAMKAYAKQWVSLAAEEAGDDTRTVTQNANVIWGLKKEIDAQ